MLTSKCTEIFQRQNLLLMMRRICSFGECTRRPILLQHAIHSKITSTGDLPDQWLPGYPQTPRMSRPFENLWGRVEYNVSR
jgi:hypothetical protein